MATAVVSGTAALMLQNRPGLTPEPGEGHARLDGAPPDRRRAPAVDANAALDGQGTANGGLDPEHADRPRDGRDRLGARELPPRELPRRARLAVLGALWTRASFRCDCGLDRAGEVDSVARELPPRELPPELRLLTPGSDPLRGSDP